MLLFAMMTIFTLALWGASRIGVPGLGSWTERMRFALVGALLFAGVDHLTNARRYLAMMPDWVPWSREVVIFTGLCVLAGAVGLVVGRTRRLAGLMLAFYFVAVFPANVRNAVDGLSVEGLPQGAWYYWTRLAFQPLFIAWALYVAGWLGRRTGGRSRKIADVQTAIGKTLKNEEETHAQGQTDVS